MPRPPLSRQSFRSSSSRRQTFQVAIDMIKGCSTKDCSPPRRNQAPSKEVYQICIASTALPCKENCSTLVSSTLQPYSCTTMNVLSANMTKLLWSWRLSSRFLGRRDVQSSNSQVMSKTAGFVAGGGAPSGTLRGEVR